MACPHPAARSNTYDILSWKLGFTFAGGNFTWGPSDADVTWQGASVSWGGPTCNLANMNGIC